jgi:thiol-disulfide isomerase/thioredoxin
MKVAASIFFLLFLFGSCQENSNETESTESLEENFQISGKIENAANLSLYLEALSQQGTISVAKCGIDSKGFFTMKGNIPGMGIYQLRLGESQDKVIPMTLVPKDRVRINSSFDAYTAAPNLIGTEWSAIANDYLVFFSKFMVEQQKLNAQQGQLSEEEMMMKYIEIRKELDAFAINQMKKDPDNPYNIILSTSAAPIAGFESWNSENLKILQDVAQAFEKKFQDSPMAATMSQQVAQIENGYIEYLNAQNQPEAQAANAVAPEIALKNPSGKTIKLSSLRGKVVLIDFWASWCGPCRAENPNVVKLYNAYKDKGFTVYSVSLDDNQEAWKRAIAADGLIWPNHVSDLKGWQTPLTQLYQFNSIPHTVLIDKNGKIIETGLRGANLEQKLKSILKN